MLIWLIIVKNILNQYQKKHCTKHKGDNGYCCLMKSNGENDCVGYSSSAYKHIKDIVKLNKKCNFDKGDGDGDCKEDSDFSIDCKSSYLVLSLLSLILLFL